jgi:peptidoglycan/xylan/chitin deacetylase (PgdA/CDA1 family)
LGSLAIGVAAWLAAPHRSVRSPEAAAIARGSASTTPSPTGSTRGFVRGNAFPDGVLALTWDDGPDAETVALGRYLHGERVSATFYVVGEWVNGTSMEPGTGTNVYGTGYEHMPVLADLVDLGHRLGSHTRNHVMLEDAALPTATATEQLVQSQRATDPFLTNELRMFRVPGGAWAERAARATDDPFLADVVGPVHWDVDRHDWDGSLYCRDAPASECEAGPLGPRVRAEAMARRYLAEIESTRRGVVLLHDRVGHVGSRWALDLARALVPVLVARGYVLAAPVLAFSRLSERLRWGASALSTVAMADIDGDHRADVCRKDGLSITCARASSEREGPSGVAHVVFDAERLFARLPEDARSFGIADVRGRGAADLCVLRDGDGGVDCQRGPAGPFERWLNVSAARSIQLGDVDGDGRADACLAIDRGVACAMSTGSSFVEWKLWLGSSESDFVLADVDGDRRADLCRRSSRGITCALSHGRGFARESVWSSEVDFAGAGPLRLADLNGDARADACVATPSGIRCALSDGRGFKHASTWSSARTTDIRLADVSGDARADLCVFEDGRVACGMAP